MNRTSWGKVCCKWLLVGSDTVSLPPRPNNTHTTYQVNRRRRQQLTNPQTHQTTFRKSRTTTKTKHRQQQQQQRKIKQYQFTSRLVTHSARSGLPRPPGGDSFPSPACAWAGLKNAMFFPLPPLTLLSHIPTNPSSEPVATSDEPGAPCKW